MKPVWSSEKATPSCSLASFWNSLTVVPRPAVLSSRRLQQLAQLRVGHAVRRNYGHSSSKLRGCSLK